MPHVAYYSIGMARDNTTKKHLTHTPAARMRAVYLRDT